MDRKTIADFWDRHFKHPTYRYGEAPNAYLAEHAPNLWKSGQNILVIGDGEGRNGNFLAQMSLNITVIEPSTEGMEKSRRLSEKLGTEITYIQGIFPDDFQEDTTFDGIVLVYVHTPKAMRERLHQAAITSLKPGGLLLLEGFSIEQLNFKSGGPPNPDMLFQEAELQGDFETLQKLDFGKREIFLKEGKGHHGMASVIQFIGKKQG